MYFTELSAEEFTKFVNSRPEKNFFQTVAMMEKIKKDGKEVYLVGVKENYIVSNQEHSRVLGATFLASTGHKFMGKKTFEAYKGYILDYNNKELLSFMTDSIKKFLKSKNALRLIIDPYIENLPRDADANIIDGIDNRPIREYLKKLGYIYNEDGEQVKWCYCLDINGKSSEELFNDFRSSTRNNINKTISKYKLNVRTLTREQLSEFKKVTSDTCDRREFADKSLTYYENMYDAFGDDVVFKICEINLDTYLEVLEDEINTYNAKIEELSDSSSNKKKKEEMRKNIENNKKKIEETKKLQEEKGNVISLSAAMFMLYGDEIVYLFSGSYAEYMSFCGQYRLQWEMIKYAADNKYKRYNFYGIEDVFNPQGKDRGVYEFKKGFGGYVEELLGSFILPISPYNSIYDTLRKVKKSIKK